MEINRLKPSKDYDNFLKRIDAFACLDEHCRKEFQRWNETKCGASKKTGGENDSSNER